MSQIIIGKVSLAPCGEFQLGKFYKRLSVVGYLGSYYIAAQDNQNILPTNYGAWYLVSEMGNTIDNIVLVSITDKTSNYRINFTNGDYFDFSITNNLVTKTDQIIDDVHYISAEASNLDNYINKDSTVSSAEILFNSSTYKITVNILNSTGDVIGTQNVTLPIGNTIRNASYDNGTITLTARDNSTTLISINGIVPTSRTIAGLGLNSNINADDLAEAIGTYTKEQLDNIIEPINKELEIMMSNFDKKEVEVVGSAFLNDSLNGQIEEPMLKGNTTQVQSTGKNKFDDSGITFKNAILNEQGEEIASTSTHYTENFYAVEPETIYTLSGTIATATSAVRIYYYNSNKDWLGRSDNISSSPTFTTPSECYYIRLQVGMPISLATGDVQLEEGSTATDYEPYTNGQPTPTPDNPSPIIDVTGTQEIMMSDLTIFDKSTIKPGDIKNSNPNIRLCSRQNLWLPIGTYTFITNLPSSYRYILYVQNAGVPPLPSYPTYIYNSGWLSDSSITFTIDEPGYFCVVFRTQPDYGSLLPSDVNQYNFFLKSAKAKLMTLHLGDLHLRKIGDYQDKIYSENGKWWLEQNVKNEILDGSESGWSLDSTYNAFFRRFTDIAQLSNIPKKVLCNYFKGEYTTTAALQWTNYPNNCIGGRGSTNFIGIKATQFTTLADFKIWLSTNNITINYVLGAPITIEITQENYPELYADLNALLLMQTYKPETNISIFPSSGNGVILDFIYWTDEKMASLNSRLKTLESQVALLE